MLAGVSDELRFASDLYRGTAGYYDRFRLSYAPALISDLLRRTEPTGQGRLLDLACGTGQLTFALCDRFASVWAVDQEPDMVEVVRAKAAAAGAGHIRPVVSAVEDLVTEPGSVELTVIGNAFHRLRRPEVARLVFGWLQPAGFLALCWSSGTQAGSEEWQLALAELLERWQAALGASSRVPANWQAPQREQPDAEVLRGAGFETAQRFEFGVAHSWTVPERAGWVRSLSVLPASALRDRGADFDAELGAVLDPFTRDGRLTETVSYAYELARKPPRDVTTMAGGGMPPDISPLSGHSSRVRLRRWLSAHLSGVLPGAIAPVTTPDDGHQARLYLGGVFMRPRLDEHGSLVVVYGANDPWS